MSALVWLIPALPLAGFVALVVGGRRLGDPWAGWLATAAVGGSFLVVLGVFADLVGRGAERSIHQELFTWIPAGSFQASMGLLADPLSITMCLFVTGVGSLIHLYAIGYMRGDAKFSKFFVYLNLFIFSMLMLVLGDNLLLTFLGWEGVGACSYFLISFWHTDRQRAGRQEGVRHQPRRRLGLHGRHLPGGPRSAPSATSTSPMPPTTARSR
jgi:NADH-quinone oxidoreductase subunit L